MSTSPNNAIDRLLRYSPWAAAALAGLCFLALIARVAMEGGPGGRGELASAIEKKQPSESGSFASASGSFQTDARRPTVQKPPPIQAQASHPAFKAH
jgi:hypothetical protein